MDTKITKINSDIFHTINNNIQLIINKCKFIYYIYFTLYNLYFLYNLYLNIFKYLLTFFMYFISIIRITIDNCNRFRFSKNKFNKNMIFIFM